MIKVAIMMGSDSDWPRVEGAAALFDAMGVTYVVRVLSAHRTPEQCVGFIREAEDSGVKVFIAAAGLAAHLPGVVAAHTRRPVIGIPVAAGPLNGLDALYAIVQMPPGIPVACVGIDNSVNAALLAVEILAISDPELDKKLVEYRRRQSEKVLAKDLALQQRLKGEQG